MKTCIVCKQFSIPGESSRSFHKFPFDDGQKQKWLSAIGLSTVPKSATVCSDHFDVKCYHETDGNTSIRRLLPGAIPSNKEPSNTQKNDSSISSDIGTVASSSGEQHNTLLEVSKEISVNSNVSVTTDTDSIQLSIPDCGINVKRSKHERKRKATNEIESTVAKRIKFMDKHEVKYISREDFVSDEAWQRFLSFKACTKAREEVKRKRNSRMKKKLDNLSDVVKSLKETNGTSAAEYLEGLPEDLKQIVHRIKENKSTAPFPLQLKTFARTLHYHSPAAYEMVRTSFLKCLPCTESLNRWNCSKNYKPGICSEIIQYVSTLVERSNENEAKKLLFNITFNEMHIKKLMFYCKSSHEWKGLRDLGGQLEDTNKEGKSLQATKALVFMLVCINSAFKTPVAYYLSNSLTGNEKCILLKDLLIELHKNNIDVVSVTFDGDESNQKACKVMGANFDYSDKMNFKPYFQHPSTSNNVYVFFDPCHMLKLVRNYFALKGPLFDENSKTFEPFAIR